VKIFQFVIFAAFLAGCGTAPTESNQHVYQDRKFSSLCQAFETVVKEEALRVHLTKSVDDFPQLRAATTTALAKRLGKPAPSSSQEQCADLLELKEGDETQLYYSALKVFMSLLDPHSGYLTPKEAEAEERSDRNEAEGIGVAFQRRLVDNWREVNSLKVEEVFRDSSADGILHAGDEVASIGSEPVSGKFFDSLLKLIRELRPTVTLTLKSGKEVALNRSSYKWNPVLARRITSKGRKVGYLKLRQFTPEASDILRRKMEAIENFGGVDIWLLDLRNNPGGLLTEAVKVIELFKPEGVVVATSGNPNKKYRREENPNREYKAQNNSSPFKEPVLVLINQGTASASEIVAGGLARDRALVAGERSFGKGTGWIPMPLSERNGLGGVLIVTTFRYSFPDNYSPQIQGVKPHVVVEDPPLKKVIDEMRSKMLLLEEDYGKELVVPRGSTVETRSISRQIAKEKKAIEEKQANGEFAELCSNSDDCQREMGIAFAASLIDVNI
jgi:carboxyl-terminal processing protease